MSENIRDQKIAGYNSAIEEAKTKKQQIKSDNLIDTTGLKGNALISANALNNLRQTPFGNKKTKREQAPQNKIIKENERLLETEQNVANAETLLRGDMQAADGMVDDVLGAEGTLSRIRDDASVMEARNAYSDATNLRMQKDQGLRQLQGAEASQARALQSQLGASGVKGGAAGAAFTDLASMNLRNRAALEQDLAVQNVQAQRERANFETQLAQFDLDQTDREKAIRFQTRMGLTQYSQSVRQGEAQDTRADAIGSQGGGGTVLCTAMFHNGLINADYFYCDVEAGRNFLSNRSTRKAFLLYNRVCKPIANYAVKHRWFALLISPIVVPVAKHFKDNNLVGRVLFSILSAPFKLAAKVL